MAQNGFEVHLFEYRKGKLENKYPISMIILLELVMKIHSIFFVYFKYRIAEMETSDNFANIVKLLKFKLSYTLLSFSFSIF